MSDLISTHQRSPLLASCPASYSPRESSDMDSDRSLEKSPSHSVHDLHTLASKTIDDNDTQEPIGVRKMTAIARSWTTIHYCILYLGFILLAYSLSLDQYINSTLLATAMSESFGSHSLLSTIMVVKAVAQAVSQPPVAKIADSLGRLEAYVGCLCLYVVGYVIVSTSPNVYAFAIGAAINILGITGLFLLQEIIIADISTLRNRLLLSILPSLLGTINVWVAANIADFFVNKSTWRWGYGLVTITSPILAIPILLSLGLGWRAAKKRDLYEHTIKPKHALPFSSKVKAQFWEMDVIGLVLLVVGSGLILIVATIANGLGSSWSDGHSIAMLVVGAVALVAFVIWEAKGAKYPLLPFKLLSNRTVLGGIGIAILHPAAGGLASNFFYTYLVVAANQSVTSATRITAVNGFAGILVAIAAGLVVRHTQRLKPLILLGGCCDILGIGLMIRFRGAGESQGALATSQLVRGVAEGLIGFPVQAAVQAATKHEHVAAVTAVYLLFFYLSSGIGSAIAGACWTSTLPGKMRAYLGDVSLAKSAYSDPFTFASTYPVGTPERDAVIRAYNESQHLILYIAIALAAAGLVVSFFLKNPKMVDQQSLPEAEEENDQRTL